MGEVKEPWQPVEVIELSNLEAEEEIGLDLIAAEREWVTRP